MTNKTETENVNVTNSNLRAENEALRQRVSDLISDANGREIDMNKMRHRVEDLENRNAALQLIVDELALREENEKLKATLRSIAEYWNGSHNERALVDACERNVLHALAALGDDAARATLRGKERK